VGGSKSIGKVTAQPTLPQAGKPTEIVRCIG
jgi:hypothetical protein